MNTILSADYIDFTDIEDLDARNAPPSHPYSVMAETFYRSIRLYAFRTMEDAETALANLMDRKTETALCIYENSMDSKALGHW